MIGTFLAGTGELADPGALTSLQVGARLALRLGRRPRLGQGGRSLVEVQAEDGRALGYLPSGDAEFVADMLGTGASATARVSGMVPGLQRPRVQLVVEFTGGAGGEA
ncbi:hypothetical protein [Roseicella aerolata]|uniref:HIRAN domain-containing protein n=1 Tax=Roseicella aerolata TaxID=2883479 RepID=A0A9X1ICL6_9PROT|nr:hypothetical protein [Roseicella aerolata]MCB4820565.1 hypothetical protein [Roseicella aerolata]